MSPLGQIHHPHPIPLDSQAHVPVMKPAETEEAAFCINAKQIHRILKRRATRQKFEEKFGLDGKSRKPYLHESLHNHAMRSPRGPDGRFLARAEVAAMANGTDGEGDEGCVNDARGTENTKSIISTTICPLAATFQGYINTEDVKQGRFLSPSQHHELGRITPRDELITQKFDAPINTTGMNSTLDHFHGPVPMTHAYSSPIIQQGEISMDYSTDIIGCYYAPQHLLLSYLQPQYEEQQYTMFYSLPHYLGEQLAAPTQPSGTDFLM
ncbi:hypothetical protein CEP54_000289 [Fusarium duplospermum]|uniref:Transcriptional activator HAP2 n=1 Tax=Fusarium duplospermum TaxID=1325734 RepID=A0A428R897_9HYPO|nr:hypothetical protein CEP54_000289 [Fusarium duplospermum]